MLTSPAMELLPYIEDMDRRAALARAVKTSPAYLYQIATGRRRPSVPLAKAISVATDRLGPEAVPRASLLPDVWGDAVTDTPAAAAGSN